ncbi:hypothetical protein BUALT_Bualt16G0097100 [Buddleja alternifolia]|uniref:CCHC-type domain-containing protein n=1 Tax=Buddleja alternifolia TaxID=168488 RepID=A0AAV6WFS9_9LAMI|nr:hypothetical protein BUALT_Bualt16G0097100 [Buddleja alternifolia]
MDLVNALVDSTTLLNMEDLDENPQLNFDDIKTFTLVGKVISEKYFNVGAVKNTLLKAWNWRNRVDRGNLVVLKHRDLDKLVKDIDLDSATFWIQASNLPARFMTPMSAKQIGNLVGRFIKTDMVSESQRWRKALRIRVEIDICKPLKDSILFHAKSSANFLVEIQYERLSDFCFKCGRIGHKYNTCTKVSPEPDTSNFASIFPFGPWLRAESTLFVRPINPSVKIPLENCPDPVTPSPSTNPISTQLQNPNLGTQNAPTTPFNSNTANPKYEVQGSSQQPDTCHQTPRHVGTDKPINFIPALSTLVTKEFNYDIRDSLKTTLNAPDFMNGIVQNNRSTLQWATKNQVFWMMGGLVDLGFEGSPFTWNNKRGGIANIQLRLDRYLAYSSWLDLFPKAFVSHLPAINFDHTPLILHSDSNQLGGPKPFCFENMWVHDSSFKSTISVAWKVTNPGSTHFSLHSKIKSTRLALRRWNRNNFGHCQRNISLLQNLIASVQSRDQSIENRKLEDAFVEDFNELLKREETM